MAITNYEVIQYTNDTVRVMAEKLRALKYEIDAAMTKYNSGIGAVCVADMAGIVEDGRESEGVSRLTGNDIVGVAVQMAAIQTLLAGVGVMDIIIKPCVRPLKVLE
jgi:hypothetical protein